MVESLIETRIYIVVVIYFGSLVGIVGREVASEDKRFPEEWTLDWLDLDEDFDEIKFLS